MKILLGATGSVAATLTASLATEFEKKGHEVRVVLTEKSLQFVKIHSSAESLFQRHIYPSQSIRAYLDSDEFTQSYEKNSPILHIDLRNWADVLIIAPLTANSLAKLANGFCDNLLTSIARAWMMSKPVIVAPAMNTHMWTHGATEEHLDKLSNYYPKFTFIPPVHKVLACGEEGLGAMAPISAIIERAESCVQ